jgi:hypothetical protein
MFKKTNLNMTKLRRSWRALVLLPLRRCRHPLCSPRVVGGVREGVSWMAIASSDRRLGGGVAKGAPKPEAPPSGRCLWSSRARRDGPPLVTASGVANPHGKGPLRSIAPPPPPKLPPPMPPLHAVPSRGSPPSSRVATPASAGS